MNRSSSHARLTHRLAAFSFLVLSVLLTSRPAPFAADKAAPAGWRFTIKAEEQKNSTISLNNRCSAPHRFRVRSGVEYLRFAQPTDAILIGAASTQQIGMVFDATGLKPKVYRDKVVVECLDCKKEKGCSQDKDELFVEMTVLKPNIYSWCVQGRETFSKSGSARLPTFKCEVISVTPNYTPEPCKGPVLTIPNTGAPYPKIGDPLPLDKCATSTKRIPPNPNIKPQ
jgi:hypothetical protein